MFKFLILIRKFIKKLLETNDRTVMADNFNWLGEENERCNQPFKSELVNKEKKIYASSSSGKFKILLQLFNFGL